MDFVRVKSAERVYDRDAVLGRDSTSVFPTEIAAAAAADRSAAAEAIGGRTFITESELEAIKAEKAGKQDLSESAAPNDGRPLAVVLAENKQAKEDAFQAQWTQMKTGKNRPLDEDELEFLNGLQQQEASAEEAWESEQASQLEAYQEAVKQRPHHPKVHTAADCDASKLQSKVQTSQGKRSAAVSARSAPMFKVVRKDTAHASVQPKRHKNTESALEEGPAVGEAEGTSGGGLAALMGDYTDDSE